MKIKLSHMEVFRAIMITGSTVGAAKMLYMSQSVVSRTLSHMESRIGFVLFERSGGALIPTEKAIILLKEVTEIFNRVQRFDSLVDRMSTESSRRIFFSSSPSLGMRFIPIAIREFLEKNSSIEFSYQTSLIKDMPAELLAKFSEFGLTIWPINHPNLENKKICSGRLMIAVNKKSPLANLDRIQLKEISKYPKILYLEEMPISGLIRAHLTALNISTNPVIEVSSIELACGMVNEDLGVALVHNLGADETVWPNLAFKEIDVYIEVSVYLVTSKFTKLSKDSIAFIEGIQNRCAEHSKS